MSEQMPDNVSVSSSETMDGASATTEVPNREVLELQKLQREMSRTDPMIPEDDFMDLVEDRALDIVPSGMEVSKEALDAAQAAVEAHIVRLFQTAQKLAIHAGHRMVRLRDLSLAQDLARDWFDGNFSVDFPPYDSSGPWEELRRPSWMDEDEYEDDDEDGDPGEHTDADYHTDELKESDWETVDEEEVVEVSKREAKGDAVCDRSIKRTRVSVNERFSAGSGQKYNPIVID